MFASCKKSKPMTNTVQNILQNNLRGTACKLQTQVQLATTDVYIDLNVISLSDT